MNNFDKKIYGFSQIGVSPSRESINNFYVGMGFNFHGFLSTNASDILGLTAATAKLQGRNGYEAFIEITWQKYLNNRFFIQPDLQYIIHPSGIQSGLTNALVTGFRIGFNI